MRVRSETDADRAAIRAVNEAAFESSAEADIVEALRAKGVGLVSLVAERDGVVLGHILFSPVLLAGHGELKHGARPDGRAASPSATCLCVSGLVSYDEAFGSAAH